MNQPTRLLAILPVLLLIAAPAARAEHRESLHAKKKILRLADEVADGARDVQRTASGRHGRHRFWGPAARDPYHHGFYGPRSDYTLRLLADLEHRARDFERALRYRPLVHTHREYETLVRSFNRAGDALYRVRVSPALERDFECLAEYMLSLDGYYQEYAYPRRARYRGDRYRGNGRYDRRVEVHTPGWDVAWRQRGFDRDGDSDSDSDSDSY